MKKELTINCPAKINLSLDVINRRSDGYHNLEMIMQEIKLFDRLTVSVDTGRDGGIYMFSESSAVPADENNLVVKAAKLFFSETDIFPYTEITLEKNIPVGAGLGGGSSDAAGTLSALNTLLGEPLSIEQLFSLAAKLGADVPFFLYRGCMLAEGIGEILTPKRPLEKGYIVLAKPDVHISTPHVYKSLVLDDSTEHPDTKSVLLALETQDIDLLAKSAGNVLETVTAKECKEIDEYKSIMMECGAAYSLMSGSGSSVFGIFKEKSSAEAALRKFKSITKEAFLV